MSFTPRLGNCTRYLIAGTNVDTERVLVQSGVHRCALHQVRRFTSMGISTGANDFFLKLKTANPRTFPGSSTCRRRARRDPRPALHGGGRRVSVFRLADRTFLASRGFLR